jgi:hypothetical protein
MQISLKHQIYQKPGKVYEERGTESWLGPIHNERRKQNKFLFADNTNSLPFCECYFSYDLIFQIFQILILCSWENCLCLA